MKRNDLEKLSSALELAGFELVELKRNQAEVVAGDHVTFIGDDKELVLTVKELPSK